jgi:heterodisulfide reductase subunit A
MRLRAEHRRCHRCGRGGRLRRICPGWFISRNAGHGCSLDALAVIKTAIIEKNLNRIVIGGCSPRTHENLFQNTLREAGINKYLMEMANIRDQDTWVHMNNPEMATAKARDLIRMAVAGVSERPGAA